MVVNLPRHQQTQITILKLKQYKEKVTTTYIMFNIFFLKGNEMTNKAKLKMKKFTNLQRQERKIEPMNEKETKYIQELLQRINDENIPTNSRGSLRPQHI